ncbi:MAG: hypothetical protein Aureis2KO_03020 [Aureisphaera sp.]
MEWLKQRFYELMARYTEDVSYVQDCWQELETLYSQPSRHYHNLNHVNHMINGLETFKDKVVHWDTLLFAIFYHDAVYHVKRQDNEIKSADLMEEHLGRTSFSKISMCRQLIEATKRHESYDDDMRVLMDLDLAILGQDSDDYNRYAKNIRKEYSVYPGFLYRKGRRKVLKHFLEKDRIFKTDHYSKTLEGKARENLNRELQTLS